MFKVCGDYYSGNCYKVKLLLTQLRQSFKWVHVDILKKESRTPQFLTKNPNGKIPLLEIEPDTFLAESNAIMHYLSEGTFVGEAKTNGSAVVGGQLPSHTDIGTGTT